MILKWSHLLLLFHLFNHLKVPSHECSNSFPLIATVMTLDPCLQSWHHAQLTTEAVPSSALTLNTTTRAPTKPRQELSATAKLDSLCWMTGGHVVVSILMFCFFVFPQSFHWDLNITSWILCGGPQARRAVRHVTAQQTTGNILHMFYDFDVSRLTDEHKWAVKFVGAGSPCST